jgi:hypothetical protein
MGIFTRIGTEGLFHVNEASSPLKNGSFYSLPINKVELSNKFSKAIFFSNNQEFKQDTKEEQEIEAVEWCLYKMPSYYGIIFICHR